MKCFFVYILKCSDGSYYTGHTDNLEKRWSEHNLGKIDGYTKTRLPVKLVYMAMMASRREALAAERRIKGWTRKKKEALIKKDWNELMRLSNEKK
jgi:predicted GIY-YIG superfamily endonuclease